MLKRVQSHRFPLMLNAPPPPATNDNSECIFIVRGDVDLYCHFLAFLLPRWWEPLLLLRLLRLLCVSRRLVA